MVPTVMYVAMLHITRDVGQLIDFSRVSPVLMSEEGGRGGNCECDRVSAL